ncbi:hypothetical protein TNCV_4157331 [Trichonephila clavipes]|nr:hypothetical protein TNCV_4157331 [Trichonephila clavipes]
MYRTKSFSSSYHLERKQEFTFIPPVQQKSTDLRAKEPLSGDIMLGSHTLLYAFDAGTVNSQRCSNEILEASEAVLLKLWGTPPSWVG